MIDQLSARQDPLANNLRGIQDQLRGHQFTPQIRQQLTDAQNAAIAMTSGLRGPGSPLGSALDQVGNKGQDLTNKLTQLRDGAQQVASGNAELASGIAKLDDGARQLKAGSAELATKLAEGAKQVPDWTNQQKDAVADTIGGPVQLEASHENAAPNFGTGMAPFFLTLALFFGALVLWMVLRPLQTRPIAAEVLAIRVVLASYLPAAAIGVFQATILYCVVRFGLGMHAVHPFSMLAFMILVSCAFVAATQAINALFGPAVGRVLIMALAHAAAGQRRRHVSGGDHVEAVPGPAHVRPDDLRRQRASAAHPRRHRYPTMAGDHRVVRHRGCCAGDLVRCPRDGTSSGTSNG